MNLFQYFSHYVAKKSMSCLNGKKTLTDTIDDLRSTPGSPGIRSQLIPEPVT